MKEWRNPYIVEKDKILDWHTNSKYICFVPGVIVDTSYSLVRKLLFIGLLWWTRQCKTQIVYFITWRLQNISIIQQKVKMASTFNVQQNCLGFTWFKSWFNHFLAVSSWERLDFSVPTFAFL